MAFNIEKSEFSEKKVEILYPMHEIDAYNGEELKSHVAEVLSELDSVVINFSRVNYLNSSGLRELIQILKTMREHNKPLFLTSVNDEIMKIFKSTNLNRLFSIYDTNEDAMRYLV
jgi:anti-sigma B factor antagonist